MIASESLLRKTFRIWRARPAVWAVMTLACIPAVFATLLSGGTYLILATLITFFLVFLAWCFAGLAYFVAEGQRAYVSVRWRTRVAQDFGYFVRLSLFFELYQAIYVLIGFVPFVPVLILLLKPWKYGTATPQVFNAVYWPLLFGAYSLASLLIVRIAMSPQVAMLALAGRENRAKTTIQESKTVVRKGYGRVLSMFLPAWIIGYALSFGFLAIRYFYAKDGPLSLLVLASVACIEGAMFSFIAAGFSEYFKEAYKVGKQLD